MKTLVFSLLTVALFATPQFAQANLCPSHGKPLTIQQVMINFGHYVTPADSVTTAGLNSQSPTDAQLQEAASDLGVAIACADAVTQANGNDPHLVPSSTLAMTPEARAAYMSDFLDLMLEFHDSLVVYQNGVTTVLQTPVASRDYQALNIVKQAAGQAADHAHSKLAQEFMSRQQSQQISFKMMDVASLKDNMHQIGQLFRQIGKTMTDATANQANATAATQIAALFVAGSTQVPDVIAQMPADQQAAAMADYTARMQQEADEATQLATAFTNDDNATAQTLVTTMTSQKTDGHAHYNP